MPKLKAWFYNPQEDTSGFVNKLVSRLDPPFCHCELQFGDNQACSIYMGSNVVFKERAFQSSNYTAVELECALVCSCAVSALLFACLRLFVANTRAHRRPTSRCMPPPRSTRPTASASARCA